MTTPHPDPRHIRDALGECVAEPLDLAGHGGVADALAAWIRRAYSRMPAESAATVAVTLPGGGMVVLRRTYDSRRCRRCWVTELWAGWPYSRYGGWMSHLYRRRDGELSGYGYRRTDSVAWWITQLLRIDG